MKINKTQLENFKKICEKNNEFVPFFTDEDLQENIENVIAAQGYWSGVSFRYYLDGDNWRTEKKQLGI